MQRICFITDLHIDQPAEKPLGIDTRVNFVNVLNNLSNKKWDMLILGGDLCHKQGDKIIYHWIREQMAYLDLPFCSIPGNHDDAGMMAEIFGTDKQWHPETRELYYKIEAASPLIFLDTSAGDMSEEQFRWFEHQIVQSGESIAVFMHHPPLVGGSKHMEPKYIFKGIEKFENICFNWPDKWFNVFCGHYHMERMVSKKNINVHITPSTFIQIDPDFEKFSQGLAMIGFREIVIHDGGTVFTNVIYY